EWCAANPGTTARVVTLPDLPNPILNRAAAEMPVLAPPPATAPAPPTPAEHPPSRRRWWIGALIVAAIAMAVTVAITLRSRGSRTQGTESVRTAVIERRDFVRTLRITGTVEATQSYIVAAPSLTGGGFGSMVITRLATAGSKVKKGDLLVEFDRQAQIKNALDKRAEYRDLVEQIKKKQAELAIARVKDETELKQAEDAVRGAELEVSRNEVVSRIDAEKNQANLEEARARLKQLQETFQLKRRAAQAELRVLEIQRDRARSAMAHAERNAEKMAVRAPLEGTVVLNTIWKSGQMGEVQEGDEVRAGVPFMQVMYPASMQVRAKVNQADLGYLRPGQRVEIRLDAYPALVLPGRLDRVAAIGVTSQFTNRVRTFTALFTIEGTDPKLMPDLSAAVDLELERVPNSLVAPRDAVVEEGGANYVYLKDGTRRAVALGQRSDHEVIIESGLDAGTVVLRNPSSRSW